MGDNLIKCHRLIIPVHTANIVDLILTADPIEAFCEINLEVRFVGEVRVCVQVDGLITVAVIHGDEVVRKDDSFFSAVFKSDAGIVIVL